MDRVSRSARARLVNRFNAIDLLKSLNFLWIVFQAPCARLFRNRADASSRRNLYQSAVGARRLIPNALNDKKNAVL
jgi:hypothetical protein